MSQADDIRAYAYKQFVAPQLESQGSAVVRAGDVHRGMGLPGHYAAVRSALRGKIFQSVYGLRLTAATTDDALASAEYTYEPQPSSAATLPTAHVDALRWFEENSGNTVSWQDLSDRDQKLAIMPKGIYRPAGWRHVLSIKVIPAGRYPDEEPTIQDGRLRFRYHQEEPKGSDPATYFTNVGLQNAMSDRVPIGVVRQVKPKPGPLYEVLGLGQVVDWRDKFFTIELEAGEAFGTNGSDLDEGGDEVASTEPVSLEDARRRIQRAIVSRRGQAAFRAKLLGAYQGRCAVSGCDVAAVLEAAHIKPYLGDHTDVVSNGLLLRADLHTLFDLGLLKIEPASRRVSLHSDLRGTEYEEFEGRTLFEPADPAAQARAGLSLVCLVVERRRYERHGHQGDGVNLLMTFDSGIDWPAWVQAVGSIVAIFAAIGLVAYQECRRDHEARKREREMAQAAASLACTAIERVADRFAAAAHEPDKPMRYSLRGFRTTEAVEALRELDVAALPPSLIEAFSQVRADAYAVNARISEVFKTDARRKAERLMRLESAGRVFIDALDALGRLRKVTKRYKAELRYVTLKAGLERFLETCKQSDNRSD